VPSHRVVVTDLLIDDADHRSLDVERSVLSTAGVELMVARATTPADIIEAGRDAVGMLVTYARVDESILEALPDLRVIVKLGIGYDNIDVAAADRLGISVANVPDYGDEEVAVHALTLILTAVRAVPKSSLATRNGRWLTDLPALGVRRFSSMRVGTIGMGRIARRLHSYLAAFNVRRVFFDPYVDEVEGAEKVDSVESLISECDVVSLHLPLNENTRGIISHGLLSKAKRRLILVNTARAGLIDRDALAAALRSGTVAHFGSDVFWSEPFDFNDSGTRQIVQSEAVVVTPHIAWYSDESDRELRAKASREVLRVIDGKHPLHEVGRARLARLTSDREYPGSAVQLRGTSIHD
jgi:D-3-phosphoglycerate dehydrogenase